MKTLFAHSRSPLLSWCCYRVEQTPSTTPLEMKMEDQNIEVDSYTNQDCLRQRRIFFFGTRSLQYVQSGLQPQHWESELLAHQAWQPRRADLKPCQLEAFEVRNHMEGLESLYSLVLAQQEIKTLQFSCRYGALGLIHIAQTRLVREARYASPFFV